MPPLKLRVAAPEASAALEARRDFLKLFALSVGGSQLVGCARAPDDPIVPAVSDTISEDVPALFATAINRGGYASGVLVKTRYGHPIKVEGNPQHPASLGGTDIFAQASIYSLWDANRAAPVQRRGKLSSWKEFFDDLHVRLGASRNGARLRILAEPSTSPTLRRLRNDFIAQFPASRWHTYSSLARDNVYKGTELAFGRALEPRYDFSRVDVVVSLEADFLTALPGSVRYAKDFAARREPSNAPSPPRLYSIESSPNSVSILADHRLALRPHEIESFAASLLAHVEGQATDADVSPQSKRAAAIAKDLNAHRGAGLVLCGDHQPAEVHYLTHAINARLANIGDTVAFGEPLLDSTDQLASLRDLGTDIRNGAVDTLLILGGNPAYTAPHDLEFASLIDRVSWSAHLGACDDETSLRCDWHVPLAHELETWGDARAYDGTASIAQPVIAPLHQGKSIIELMSAMLGADASGLDLLRETWRASMPDFETAWTRSLRDGVVASASVAAVSPTLQTRAPRQLPKPPNDEIDFLFRPDASVDDGAHASNAWLQELPKPFSQLTWSNAAMVSPATAKRLGVADEDVVRLAVGNETIDAPILTQSGIADGCVVLPLGYGRTRSGEIGAGLGFDAGTLRSADVFWHARGSLGKTGKVRPLARTQRHALTGRDGPIRVDAFPSEPTAANVANASLFAPRPRNGDYAWGMAINLNNCMGCNVCTIACQSENNIPTVGSEQVRRGRAMHWIRIDHYVEEAKHPRLHSQPVPCMHCENAPCEVVCPVGATVHDSEGLNVQVYNRCIGTRFCANNCPYKVRRFNFLQFSKETSRDYANPDVTVRNRGVMEKCTYCVQRIETARIETDKAGRKLRDGEVLTACQAACPTSAIVFGDLNDPDSAVSRAKSDPRNYALLAELNTNPRTTYLSKLRVVNREFDDE